MKTHNRTCVPFLVACLMMISLGVVSTPTYAGHDLNIFELEGNAVDDTADDPPEDWEDIFDDTDTAEAATFIGQSVEAPGNDVTYFTGGGSKDVNDIPQWLYSPGDVSPDKDEITDAYAGAYRASNQDLILYFGLDRFAQAGSAQVGFWFFRNSVSLKPLNGGSAGFNGVHAARAVPDVIGGGDLLILSDFTKGGKVSNIKVFEWVGDGSGSAGNLDLILDPLQALCNGGPADEACAIANDAGIASPWPYTPKAGAAGTIPDGGFFEGNVNLTQLLNGNVGCFTAFLAETRSSGSATTAQLKDFALGEFALCDIEVTKTTDVAQICNASGAQNITYMYTVTNPGAVPLEVTLVDDNGTPGNPSDDLDVIAEDASPGSTDLNNLQTITLNPGVENAQAFDMVISVSGEVHNVVTATGTAGGSSVTDTADTTVTVAQCTIEITKTPDRATVCSQNAAVNYSYVLTNTGDVNVDITQVTDDKGTPDNTGDDPDLLAANSVAAPHTLAPGASLNLSFTTTLPAGIVTNTVQANGIAELLLTPVTAQASAVVEVKTCAIQVTKACTDASGEGAPITFTGSITNIGEVAITGIALQDANDEGVQPIVLGTTTLAPGASTAFSGSYTPTPTSGLHTDTVTVNGTVFAGELAETAVADTDSASCQIVTAPAITVTKACTNGAFPPADSPISFTGTVTNSGNVTLNNVTVFDDQVGGSVLSGISLAPGVSANFNGSYAPTHTWNKNTVTASGEDAINSGIVQDDDAAICQGCPFVPNPLAGGSDSPLSPGTL